MLRTSVGISLRAVSAQGMQVSVRFLRKARSSRSGAETLVRFPPFCYSFRASHSSYAVVPVSDSAGIVAALASTYLTARFSFSRFRQEQWWQAKRDAYESIIRKFAEIMFESSRELERIATGIDVVPRGAPERKREFSWSLQEIAASGAYIVSEKTVVEIGKFLTTVSAPDDGDFYGVIDREYGAARDALAAIRAEAHRDLGVENNERPFLRKHKVSEKEQK
jgi:hypothetical protein